MTSDLASTLRNLRERSGLSLAAVARRANCSKSEVGHAESGFRVPSESVVLGLDSALGAAGELVALADSARQDQRRLRAARQGQADVVLRLRVEGREVVMSLDRRSFLQGGASYLIAAFGLDADAKKMHAWSAKHALESPLQIKDVLIRLRDQWHDLVRLDNQVGPQAAITHVHNQLTVLQGLLTTVRGSVRADVVRLGAQYAESIAWLHEDLGEMDSSRQWVSRAADWAFEAGDHTMLAWTMFRRSQQAGVDRDGGQVIGLTQAIRRDEDRLPAPMRAALRVQEAFGHALDGKAAVALRLLDDAHHWAAMDTDGDARGGHGSFCTPGYIEVNRANCLLTVGRPAQAVKLYQRAVPSMPEVYLRDRVAASSRMAAAYVANGDLDRAATTTLAILPLAHSTGSVRIIHEVERVAASLAPHRSVPGVAEMLEAVRQRKG